MADGDFFRGTFFRVQRHIAWLLICKSRQKGCYIKIPWTPNTVNCEHETLPTVNRKQCNLFLRYSNFKSETVSRAGQIVWHWRWLYTCPPPFSEKGSRPVWADCKALWAHDMNQPWCFVHDMLMATEHYHTHLRPLICVALGMEVMGWLFWFMLVGRLMCCFCFYIWLFNGFLFIVLVYIFVVGWFIFRFLCWVYSILVSWFVHLFFMICLLMILVSCLVNNVVRIFVVNCWISSFLMCVLLIVLGLLLIVLCFVVCCGGLADELGHAPH